MTNFTRVFQPIPSWLNWPIVLNGPDLQQHRLTNTIHLTLKMTSAQVVETSVTNNSSFQNYTHPDDHTIRTTDTPGFKPFTIFSVVCARLSVSVKILELFLFEETVNAIVLVFSGNCVTHLLFQNFGEATTPSHCTLTADTVQWLSQSDYSICISILVEFYLILKAFIWLWLLV